MSFMRGSAMYVWCTTWYYQCSGKRGGGAVFQGVNKNNGELVAVNIFNQLSHMPICAPRMFRCENLRVPTMPELVLYYDEISPPVRAVLMTYQVLGIELTLQKCDLFKRENRTPEFIKMNPLHTVPVLKDGEANITDSHAIMCYLADKYGTTNNTLFPKDLLERATVMERLFFECGVLFKYDADLMYGIFFNGITEVPADKMANILEAYSYLEIYLAESEWLAGPNMTLADLSCVATLSTLDIVVPVSSNFPRLESWLRRFQKLPFYECNQDGVNKMRAILLSKGFK